MKTEHKLLTEICCPGKVFQHSYWKNNILKCYPTKNTKLNYPPFPNWHVIKEPRFQLWVSEPIIRPGYGWVIGLLKCKGCHPDGEKVFDEIVAATLRLEFGSYIINQSS